MNCQQCGSPLDPNDVTCKNCGAANPQFHSADTTTATAPSELNEHIEDVKDFFKNNFLGMVKAIVTRPISGTYDIFINAKGEAFQQAIILIVTTGLVYIILPMIFLGRLGSASTFFGIGFSMMLILVIISTLTFLVKSINGKPDFKKELLTGGLCGIPMIILGVYFSLFGTLGFGSIAQLFSGGQGGILTMLLAMYSLLMMINIVSQSLRAAKANDALNWYISPVILLLSYYLGSLFIQSFS